MYQDLDDIVFEDRQKAYGAYALRKHYKSTLTKASIIGIIVFLLVFFIPISYLKPPKLKAIDSERIIPIELSEMRINYGDNTNGKGLEEPKQEEGSPASIENKKDQILESSNKISSENKKDIVENTVPIPTRENKNASSSLTKSNKNTQTNSNKNINNGSNTKGEVKKENASGDGKGNAAIGNLLKGRGSKAGSQGNGSGLGNYGDPLGGDGDGNSLIGIDRKLISFIPGTMGRGGSHPNHDCSANGTITIAYTVDKTGKVTSSKRQSGISDPCIVNTATSWVKQYVKAEASSVSSKGTYKIVF